MLKVIGEIVHVMSNWQSSFKVNRVKGQGHWMAAYRVGLWNRTYFIGALRLTNVL